MDATDKVLVRAGFNLYRGMQLVDDGQYKDAIRELDRALNDFIDLGVGYTDDIAQAYFSRGFAHYGLNNYDQAIEDYTQALNLIPDDEKLLCQRGLAYFTTGEHSKAVADYTSALKIEPSNHKTKMLRGMAYYAKNEFGLSIADLKDVLRADPDNVNARRILESAVFEMSQKANGLEKAPREKTKKRLKKPKRLTLIILSLALVYFTCGTHVGSAKSDKYHLQTCKWAGRINDKNKVRFWNIIHAEVAGYDPCKVCHPVRGTVFVVLVFTGAGVVLVRRRAKQRAVTAESAGD